VNGVAESSRGMAIVMTSTLANEAHPGQQPISALWTPTDRPQPEDLKACGPLGPRKRAATLQKLGAAAAGYLA
jgi:hypothetical protein